MKMRWYQHSTQGAMAMTSLRNRAPPAARAATSQAQKTSSQEVPSSVGVAEVVTASLRGGDGGFQVGWRHGRRVGPHCAPDLPLLDQRIQRRDHGQGEDRG